MTILVRHPKFSLPVDVCATRGAETETIFSLFVRHDRSYVLLELTPSLRIEVVARTLEEKLRVADASLQFGGKVLNPSLSLHDCGLNKDANLRLVPRGRGGGCQPSKQSTQVSPDEASAVVASSDEQLGRGGGRQPTKQSTQVTPEEALAGVSSSGEKLVAVEEKAMAETSRSRLDLPAGASSLLLCSPASLKLSGLSRPSHLPPPLGSSRASRASHTSTNADMNTNTNLVFYDHEHVSTNMYDPSISVHNSYVHGFWTHAMHLPGATPTYMADLVALSALDDRLCEALKVAHIRLLRSSWLLSQPEGYRIQHRQALEELEQKGASPTPLLSAEEAVALVRRCDRSAGALTYGWLSPGTRTRPSFKMPLPALPL